MPSYILDFAPFALMGVGLLFYMVGDLSSSYGKQSAHRLVYQKPILQRMGFLVSSFAMLFLWHLPDTPPGIAYAVNFSLFLVFFYLAGPHYVSFDLKEERYKARYNWPFFSRPWSGPMTDLAGIRLGRYGLLILRWKNRQEGILLGQFSSKEKALEEAKKIGVLLKIEVIPADEAAKNRIIR